MEVTVIPEVALTSTQARAMSELAVLAFVDDTRTVEERMARWENEHINPDPTRRNYLIWNDVRLLAMARTFAVTVQTATGPLPLLALAGVATHPDHERKGLGHTIVKHAFERVDNGEFTLALFMTGVPGFYQKLGCTEVHNRFIDSSAEDPEANPWWNPYVMVYAPRGEWPEGLVDLGRVAW